MRSADTFLSIAAKLRRLAPDANDELAAHLIDLAREYERMARRFVPDERPAPKPWENRAA